MKKEYDLPLPDTSQDFDDCVGKRDDKNKRGTLSEFLGISDIPETEQEAEDEFAALDPKNYWRYMPRYVARDLEPKKQLLISFRSEEDMIKFGEVIGQKLTPKTKSVWWPEKERDPNGLKRWMDESEV